MPQVKAADNTKAVSIGTTATQIVPFSLTGRRSLIVCNNGSATVYIGFTSTDCTTASALPLLPGSCISFGTRVGELWGIVSSGTVEVRVWEDER